VSTGRVELVPCQSQLSGHVSEIYVHRGGLERLRASHQALTAIAQGAVKHHRNAEHNGADDQYKNGG
jgi:hypothetical protein